MTSAWFYCTSQPAPPPAPPSPPSPPSAPWWQSEPACSLLDVNAPGEKAMSVSGVIAVAAVMAIVAPCVRCRPAHAARSRVG